MGPMFPQMEGHTNTVIIGLDSTEIRGFQKDKL
jgi:hypothetical protein